MNIKIVTLTGADDNTDPLDLMNLSEKYPFVEWGILFSDKKIGTPRYPSKVWINNLYRISNRKLNLSAHFCGSLVNESLNYGTNIHLENSEFKSFNRVQLNLERRIQEIGNYTTNLTKISKTKKLILGGNYNCNIDQNIFDKTNIFPLCDESGGRGLESSWKNPFHKEFFVGFAGGLGPDNLIQELNKIAEIVDGDIWIDMESKIRTNNKLDLEKCNKILDLVADYMQ